MKAVIVEYLLLFFSSLIPLAIVYYRVRLEIVQAFVATILVSLLIVTNRFILPQGHALGLGWRLFLLFILSTLLQVVIFLTGGFYSPFLILSHLFAVSTGFLFSLRIALGFLFFAVSTLLVNTLILDKKMLSFFLSDPWPVVLYIFSFTTIIPLYYLVVSRYNVKDAISKILTSQLKLTTTQLELTDKELKLTRARTHSLLGGFEDLIIITDTNLRVLSVNDATTRTLHLSSSELLGRFLFDVLQLKNTEGELLNVRSLTIAKVLNEKITVSFGNLLLYTRGSVFPKKAGIRVRPIPNLQGSLDQVVFIVSCATTEEGKGKDHSIVEQALLKQGSALEELKNYLRNKELGEFKAKVELIERTEKDILTTQEIEEYGLKPNITFVNVAELLYRIILRERDFAGDFKLPVNFKLDKKFVDLYPSFKSADEDFPTVVTTQYFSAPADARWLDIFFSKIMDILVLVAIKKENAFVQAELLYDEKEVTLIARASTAPLPSDYQALLLTAYYGNLGLQTNLSLGSGLEGYLIKRISLLLKIPLEIKYQADPGVISVISRLSKTPVL